MRGISAGRGGPKAWAVLYLFFRIKKVLACPGLQGASKT